MINDGIDKKGKDITSFLMIGQSNMAGRGELDEVESINNANCYMLRMGRWQRMAEPINPDRAIFNTKFHSGISLGASFADSFANRFGTKVGMIPCADGGTTISQWQPEEVLFEHAVFMTKLAMRTSNLGGILWHQGESDCHSEKDAKTYLARFVSMIEQLRKDLGNEALPVVVGGLGDFLEDYDDEIKYKHTKTVQEALKQIPSAIQNCAFASAEGLTDRGDGVHFNSKSYRVLGERYFQSYLEIAEK